MGCRKIRQGFKTAIYQKGRTATPVLRLWGHDQCDSARGLAAMLCHLSLNSYYDIHAATWLVCTRGISERLILQVVYIIIIIIDYILFSNIIYIMHSVPTLITNSSTYALITISCILRLSINFRGEGDTMARHIIMSNVYELKFST